MRWLAPLLLLPGVAGAALTVAPLTWNIIGLDSNSPASGPRQFPVGARVCSDVLTANVAVDLVWDSVNPQVFARPGSLVSLSFPSIAANACVDAYFEAEVNAVAAAFDTTRLYRIVASDGSGSFSTPTPRELYVEHLVSQSRNAITDVRFGTNPLALTSVPPGGAMNLVVGNTYTIELSGGTATQGYEQFEAFISFTNTIFQILSVSTTYSADTTPFVGSPNDKLYGDACLWQNDPNSPVYRACLADGKIGGANVVTLYTIKIIGGGGTAQTLNTLLYDFSGSSFHYNADFGIGARVANIIDPISADIAKSFTPATIPLGGASTLKLTLSNPNAGALAGYNFADNLPAGMTVANPPNAATSNCGTPTFAPIAGATTLTFTNGTVAGNSNCTVSVSVTTSATGSFVNTTDNLFIDSTDTGHIATATLTVDTTPPPPPGICGQTLARWTFPTGFSLAAPVATLANVPASALAGTGVTANTQTTLTADGTSAWGSNGAITTGATLTTANNDYFEFAIDTSTVTQAAISFNTQFKSANGPSGVAVFWGTTGQPATETGTQIFNNANAIAAQNTTTAIAPAIVSSGLNTSGNTYFRVYYFNAGNSNPGSDPVIDDVLFSGCTAGLQPTLDKSFAPNPIRVGGVSTLTFTLSNTNTVALSGAGFSDSLPTGMSVSAPLSLSNTCGGTWAPTVAATALTLSGGTLPAGGSCSVSVNVTTTVAGPSTNISDFITTTETGTNAGPGGSAVATLTAIAPPQIDKQFAPSPILAGGVSTLTFHIVNPNQNDAIGGVAFSDVFPLLPAAMTVASPPNASVTGCGAPVFAPLAGAGSVSFSGGSIAAADNCVVTVDITAPTAGSYSNVSGTVSHIVNGSPDNGNAASDSLEVSPPNPAITLLKEVGTSALGPWFPFVPVDLPGNVFYRFTMENTGDVPLSPLTLSDPLVDTSACVLPAALPVADALDDDHIFVCVVGAVSAASGVNPNTATAGGSFAGSPVSDTDSAIYASTGLGIAKSASPTTYSAAGQIINYSFVVTNSGAATLDGPILVQDDQSSDETCPALNTIGDLDDFFDPGEQITCSATYTIVPADIGNGSVVNIAFASSGSTVSPTDTATVTLVAPELSVVKTASAGVFVVGQPASYTITITNTGSLATSADITLSDNLPTGITLVSASGSNWSCSGTSALSCTFTGTLAVSASTVLTLNVSVGPSASTGDNAATAAGGDDPTCPAAAHCTGTVPVGIANPALSIAKTQTSGPNPATAAGQVLGYTIVVTNTGSISQTGVVATDTLPDGSAGVLSGPVESITTNGILEVGETWTYTIGYTVTQADIDAGLALVNTATVSTTEVPGPTPTTASTPVAGTATLTIAKTQTSGPNPATAAGQVLGYTIVVTNTGSVSQTGVVATDTLPDGSAGVLSGPVESTTPNGILEVGETWTYTITYTVSQADIDAGASLVNTATVATTEVPGPTSDTESTPVAGTATLTIVKTQTSGPNPANAAGQVLGYTIVVTNTGSISQTGVVATDTLPDGSVGTLTGPVESIATNAILEVGETWTYTIGYTVSQADIDAGLALVNTATVSTTEVPGPTSDTETTPVAGGPVLLVSKTASPVPFVVGQPASYTVTIGNTGTAATGAPITLSDPLPAGITLLGASGTNWSCTGTNNLACTFSGTIAAGGTTVLVLTVDVASSATNGDNTATASGGGDPACPAAAACTGTVPVAVVQPDLTIVKTHAGDFTAGQTGAAYTLLVSNVGNTASSGIVTVVDVLPAGLNATAMFGSGWTCTLASLSCTRADPLAVGASYPAITLLVDVAVSATGSLVNTTTVSGGGDSDPSNNDDSDPVNVVPLIVLLPPVVVPVDARWALWLLGLLLLAGGALQRRRIG